MELILYTPKGESSFRIIPDETSSHDWSLMSDNKLSVTFDWNICVDLSPGCYVDFDGVRYYLLEKYKPIMVSSTLWRYNVTFKDAASWLGITLALNNADGQNKPIFQYTAPAIEHVKIIVDNLNRRMETTLWKVGSVIESANISIDYHGKYCSEVLQELVDIQNTEWWVDDFTLNLGRAEFGERVELGYQNGLIGDISCAQPDNMHLYAYLYPIGSTRNIDPTKYGYDRLQLPNGQTTVEMNVEHGVAELYEEAAFAHIFPRYEGTVQSVRSKTAIGNDGTQFTIYYFQDSYIPFNPNDYEIAGLVKNISFLSGELMGEDFEVNYDHSNHEFEIITRYPKGSVMQLPGGFLIPKVGDKYTIWNITMPEEYYPLASQEFLEAAQTFAITAQQDASVYKGETDYIDIQIRGVSLRPGQRVRLFSAEYFPLAGYYDSRITRITRKLWYPEEIKVDISASRSVGTIAKLSSGLKTVERKTNTLSTSVTTISSTLVAFKSLFDSMFEKDSDGNIHAKLSLWSSGGITAGGVGSGGTSGGGASYDRLDAWADYSADKSGWVLSALLGNDLNTRLISVENAGYVTASALAPYALRSEIPSLDGYAKLTDIPSLAGYAQQSWVGENYLSKSGGTISGALYISMYGWGNQLVLNGVDSNAGIEFRYSNTYVAALSCAQNNPYWRIGETAYPIIHSGNFSDYAIPITGGTVNGSITATSFIGNLTGNASSASQVIINYSYRQNVEYPLLFTLRDNIGIAANGFVYMDYYGKPTFNPSTGSITANSFIGTLTGNADSATKLAIPRTIWGQSFDGTEDVSGNIDLKYSGIFWGNDINNYYIGFGSENTFSYNNFYGHRFFTSGQERFRITRGGNIIIGTTEDSGEIFQVNGNGKFTGALTANSLTIGGVTLTYDSVNEALCINGNMYALGGITAGGAGISAYTSLEARVARLEQQLNIS